VLDFRSGEVVDLLPSFAGKPTARLASLVFDDAAAFAASPASLLSPDDQADEPPPAHYVEQGWAWPPRIAAESFISYGVFAPPEEATPHARLADTVVAAATRRVVLTGLQFVHAVVRTVGFDAHACFPSDTSTAPLGAIIHGTVYLVGSLPGAAPSAPPPQQRSWSLRRRPRS
jgi:hypothetical protein